MSKTTPEWAEEIDRRLDGLVALRGDFHRHPELSFEEPARRHERDARRPAWLTGTA